ncbi:glucokinase [Sphingomicrobium aestuariivivum]|uniref:glucokinase n=1 Tax=Sphingomicrobium aestuariivivum TaxID=1582356 RepID=UPI001FD63FE3|nr:glucokinase [Sphingomicrobium aestuariivivum]MCJ8191602.1 glucokinase [Sphingomicrobium aestuariivivum]
MSRTIAVADIGGTHARFAIAELDGTHVTSLSDPVTLGTNDHASFQTAWRHFCELNPGPEPKDLSIAFAGPVDGEVLKLTNNPWVIRPALAQEKLGVDNFTIVNDFAAIGHAVGELGDEDFLHVTGPEGPFPRHGVTSIVGPGTGLGVAQVLKTPDGHNHVIATEGGHIDWAPLDSLEDRILQRLRKRYVRVSIERIACGSGLVNIYEALGAIEGKAVREVDDIELWTMAMEGTDALAAAALDRFFLSLGAVAGDLALAHGANAVVLAGGLGYRLRERFERSGFAGRFIAKGRFERRMQNIPVKLVTHPQPGLYGAAVAFAKEHP